MGRRLQPGAKDAAMDRGGGGSAARPVRGAGGREDRGRRGRGKRERARLSAANLQGEEKRRISCVPALVELTNRECTPVHGVARSARPKRGGTRG